MVKYFDYKVAMSYLGGLDSLFRKVAGSFLEEYTDFDLKVKKALVEEEASAKDYMNSKLYALLHTLKGITLNLGFKQLYDELLPILASLKSGNYEKEKIASVLNTFDASFKELKEFIF